MLYWPFLKEKLEEHKPRESIQNGEPIVNNPIKQEPVATPLYPNNTFLKDFEAKIETTKPYIFTSLVAWPLYWLYRGLEWGNQREHVRLPIYIHRTYLQAKFLQIAIIVTGIAVASMESSRHLKDFRNNSCKENKIKEI